MVLADPLSYYQQGFGNALATGQQMQQMQQRNALANLYQTQGQGIAQGDAQALNALAQLDPMAAMEIRRAQAADQRAARGMEMDERRLGFEEQRLGMERDRFGMAEESHDMGMKLNKQQLEEARRAGQRAAETHAAQMDEITRQREAEEINAALSSASAAYAQGPQAFDAWKQQNAEMIAAAEMDPAAVTYEAFPGIAAGLIGAKEGLLAGIGAGQSLTAGPSPQSPEGKFYADQQAGLVPEGVEFSGGGTNVTVNNNGGGSELYDTLDKNQGEMFSTLIEGGMEVPAKMAQIDQLEGLLSDANTPEGIEAALKTAAGDFGINTEGLDNLQAARAIIKALIPQQRPAGSGPMSDGDVKMFEQSLPRLINTRDGNMMILRTLRGIAEYQANQAQIAGALANRDITPAAARDALAKLQNPLEVYRREGETTIGGTGFDPETQALIDRYAD
jgi:hypothetical protein